MFPSNPPRDPERRRWGCPRGDKNVDPKYDALNVQALPGSLSCQLPVHRSQWRVQSHTTKLTSWHARLGIPREICTEVPSSVSFEEADEGKLLTGTSSEVHWHENKVEITGESWKCSRPQSTHMMIPPAECAVLSDTLTRRTLKARQRKGTSELPAKGWSPAETTYSSVGFSRSGATHPTQAA